MQIAIASGKGGTGKTTVATNLAVVASQSGATVTYVDCDVEEPNGHLFLNPTFDIEQPLVRLIPEVDRTRCSNCGLCEEICQYSAIVCVGESPLVFPDLCHACGGCARVCPNHAIREIKQTIGQLRIGASGSVRFVDGMLNVGQPMSPPAIRQVRHAIPESDLVILDAPPGTSCPVVETVRQSDLVILVTDPTPFGIHDLKLAVQMVRALKLPIGVVVNRSGVGQGDVNDYCRSTGVPIFAELPDDRAVAEAYARGLLAANQVEGYEDRFQQILDVILQTAGTS